MFVRKLYAPLFVPAAAALIQAEGKKGGEEYVCKPSELPIYSKEEDAKKKKETKPEKEELPPPNAIENFFATIRRNVMIIKEETTALKTGAYDLVEDTQKNFEWLIKYLQEEENTNAKYGAIAAGGLAGYILALRGGRFRKLLFTTAGATTMAAICYPEEAAQYSEIAIEEGKKYATIIYNFIYGVNKDDPPLELPSLPKVPSSMSEMWGIAANVGKSVKSMISVEEEEKPVEEKKEEVTDSDEPEVEINADEIVTQVYEEATQKSCHCPIGVCTRHDEPPPPPPPPVCTPCPPQ